MKTLRDQLIQKMETLGVSPKRALGQNFLVNSQVVDHILTAAEPSAFKKTLEIGPGLGALTHKLKSMAQDFEVVELDQKLGEYWKSQGLTVTQGDALKFPWAEFLKKHPKALLVSNLPYQVAARLVVELSLISPSFFRMVLMFQKEVAQRIQGKPGEDSYGLLSVVAQCFWTSRLVCEVGAVDFIPKPHVASRVLCLDSKKSFPNHIGRQDFLVFLKKAFAHRRKKLLPQLTGFQEKSHLLSIFDGLKLSPEVRAERLKPQEFIDLYLALRRAG